MASATNKKPLEFTRKTTEPTSNASEPRRKDFLFYLANGHSIEQAYTLVGVTRKGYENWRRRHEEFPKLVEAARESHRRDIACGFHGADAYARMLLDAIQRDESLPAPLRYRASKTILTRKGKKDWLPDPIPAATETLAPYDDEQPDYFTNDFPSQPVRSEFESAESQLASPHERSEFESAGGTKASCGNERSEFESAEGATESCCHGQSESASAARGDAPSNLQAPTAAAEASASNLAPEAAQASAPKASAANLTPEAGSRKPEAGQPLKPFTPTNPPSTPNPLQNQHNPVVEPLEAAPPFSSNPLTSPSADRATASHDSHPEAMRAPASEPKASASNSTPDAGSRKPEAVLSQQWLSTHFLPQHESPRAFEKLLANHIGAYEPATPPEELLVFRITQKAWLLRRVETWERVIADSRVAKIREKHPNAAAPACIAMSLLEVKESNQTRFYERTAKLRKEHEDALDRLESKLFTSQQRREDREHRTALQTPSPPRASRSQLSFREAPEPAKPQGVDWITARNATG